MFEIQMSNGAEGMKISGDEILFVGITTKGLMIITLKNGHALSGNLRLDQTPDSKYPVNMMENVGSKI